MNQELHELFNVCAGQYRLLVYYDKMEDGLYQYFSSDGRMKEYVHSKTSEAFVIAVQYYCDDTFILNIASTENLGAFEWKNEKDFLNRQLTIFMPVIQKFMLDATTDQLIQKREL